MAEKRYLVSCEIRGNVFQDKQPTVPNIFVVPIELCFCVLSFFETSGTQVSNVFDRSWRKGNSEFDKLNPKMSVFLDTQRIILLSYRYTKLTTTTTFYLWVISLTGWNRNKSENAIRGERVNSTKRQWLILELIKCSINIMKYRWSRYFCILAAGIWNVKRWTRRNKIIAMKYCFTHPRSIP